MEACATRRCGGRKMMRSLAAVDLVDLVRPKPQGERVNSHVIQVVREPVPDFEAMRRLVSMPGSVAIPEYGERPFPLDSASEQQE